MLKRINWQFIVELLVLGVGIRVAFIYSGQLREMIDANTISRESLTSVQRAFIVSRDVQKGRHVIQDSSKPHAIWVFTMPWENTGTTPATITSQAFFADQLRDEPTEEQFMRKPLIQPSVTGPKAIRNIGNAGLTEIDLFGRELPHENKGLQLMPIQTIAIKNGPMHICWGWVTYRDVFPNTALHVTEFCQVLSAIMIQKDNPQAPFGFAWMPCNHHNCADEQCEDYKAVTNLQSQN